MKKILFIMHIVLSLFTYSEEQGWVFSARTDDESTISMVYDLDTDALSNQAVLLCLEAVAEDYGSYIYAILPETFYEDDEDGIYTYKIQIGSYVFNPSEISLTIDDESNRYFIHVLINDKGYSKVYKKLINGMSKGETFRLYFKSKSGQSVIYNVIDNKFKTKYEKMIALTKELEAQRMISEDTEDSYEE